MTTVETTGIVAMRAALLLSVFATVALAAPAFAQTAAAEDAADCGGEFWFPLDTAGLIAAVEVPIA
jgi:hypothetical protein